MESTLQARGYVVQHSFGTHLHDPSAFACQALAIHSSSVRLVQPAPETDQPIKPQNNKKRRENQQKPSNQSLGTLGRGRGLKTHKIQTTTTLRTPKRKTINKKTLAVFIYLTKCNTKLFYPSFQSTG